MVALRRLALTCALALLAACGADYGLALVTISGSIVNDATLRAGTDYLLTGQALVRTGATLTIEPGTTIRATPYDQNGLASVLVIEPGARLIADGTAEAPITFTSALEASELPARGTWGGIIVLGRAPVNQPTGRTFIEGLAGIPFGGNDPDDDSGILRYVRVWYGGRSIGEGNGINGITLGGVGRGTVLEHCEVAHNLDDGFELFGGTVNGKYLSVLFAGDDAFDADWGYQGSLQYLFSLHGQDQSGRGFEIDNDGEHMDAQPRTFPKVSNVTLVGPGGGAPAGDGTDNMIRLREGTGGDFRNLVMTRGNGLGVRVSDAASLALLTATPQPSAEPDTLYLSPQTVAFDCAKGAAHADVMAVVSVREVDPLLTQPSPELAGFDPRPGPGSPLLGGAEAVRDESFFDVTTFAGAFDAGRSWLHGWSWLDAEGWLAAP